MSVVNAATASTPSLCSRLDALIGETSNASNCTRLDAVINLLRNLPREADEVITEYAEGLALLVPSSAPLYPWYPSSEPETCTADNGTLGALSPPTRDTRPLFKTAIPGRPQSQTTKERWANPFSQRRLRQAREWEQWMSTAANTVTADTWTSNARSSPTLDTSAIFFAGCHLDAQRP